MVAPLEHKPLGQLLLDRSLIKPEHLDRALEEQKRCKHQKLLGEVLVDLRFCTEDQICESLAKVYGIPHARVSPRLADPRVTGLLPREFLEKHRVLPLYLVEGLLTVAVSEPANIFLLEEVERLSGYPVQVVAATARDIRSTLQAYLPTENVFVIDDLIDEVKPEEFRLVDPITAEPTHFEQPAGDGRVTQLVNFCIHRAVKDGASDIHIEPGEKLLRVRYRVDGRLTEKLRPPHQMAAAIAARIKAMATLDPAERRLPQDGIIHAMLDGRPVDLRVSTMPGKHGEKLVIRIIDNERTNVNLEKLGFSYDTLKLWRKLIRVPSGLLLVTGPTDSGTTSTLYASLAELNGDSVNICTVEDPVDYPLPGVNQFQVDEKIGFGYPAALRSLLRQDPDVVMAGAIRDPETAKIVSQAALTGHLVLTSLHTTDAPSAITRLFNLGVEQYTVGAALTGVLAQRLVRKLCQSCREAYAPSINERRQMENVTSHVETLYRPKGCARCRNIGYAGRIGLYELLAVEDAMVDKISLGAPLNEIRETARASGMKPLRADGIEKVRAGITTLDEVFRVTA